MAQEQAESRIYGGIHYRFDERRPRTSGEELPNSYSPISVDHEGVGIEANRVIKFDPHENTRADCTHEQQ
jgi:hypothetical protein